MEVGQTCIFSNWHRVKYRLLSNLLSIPPKPCADYQLLRIWLHICPVFYKSIADVVSALCLNQYPHSETAS